MKKKNEELVSIIIPVYNCEKFIQESIYSCMVQSYTNIEVIVVNDGSTDNTFNIISEISIQNLKVKVINLKHGGKVKAINEGIKGCSGKYIAIHAADDICMEYRIEEQVRDILEKSAYLSYGDMEVIDEQGNLIYKSYWDETRIKIEEKDIFACLLQNNFVSGGTILIDTCVKDKVFPIPETLEFEDWWIATITSFYGKLVYIRKPLIKYRQHKTNDNSNLLEKNVTKIVEKQKKIITRNFVYYDEFRNFIYEHVYNVEESNKYLQIIKYSELMYKLIVTSRFKLRMKILIMKLNKYFFKLSRKLKIKVLGYAILGERGLRCKVYLKKTKAGWKSVPTVSGVRQKKI